MRRGENALSYDVARDALVLLDEAAQRPLVRDHQSGGAMRRVIVESPFAGNVARNQLYARAAMLDCLRRGEAPFASHLLYTQVLDDNNVDERNLGIEAGLCWGAVADATVVYNNLGLSSGMIRGVHAAEVAGRPVEYRTLDGRW